MSHTPPARVAPGRSSGPVVATVVVAVVVGALVPLLVAHHYGALGIPRSDDWSYLVTQFRWTDGDGLSFNHWVTMTLIGQLVLSAPVTQVFRHDIAALQWFTAATGALGLGATVLLVRRAGAPTGLALVGALAIGLCPLWGPLAASYMTDVPAFTCSTVALLLGVEALRRDQRATPWLVAATLVGVLAFSIRQYAGLPTVTVLVVALVDAHRTGRRAAVRSAGLALAGFAIAAIAISAWWSTVPAGRAVAPSSRTPTRCGCSSSRVRGSSASRGSCSCRCWPGSGPSGSSGAPGAPRRPPPWSSRAARPRCWVRPRP